MNYQLLKNSVLVAGISIALIGCDGPDKGLAIGFSGDAPVEYSTPSIDKSFDEEGGTQSVDLL